MAKWYLDDDEDLIARFRPHPASWLRHFAGDGWWLVYGGFAWWLDSLTPGFDWDGTFVLALLAIGHFLAASHWQWRGRGWAALVFCVAAAATIVSLGAAWPGWFRPSWAPPLLGALTTGLALGRTEFARRRNDRVVTTRRIQLQEGRWRVELKTVDLDRVRSVESSQGILGQIFDFGRLRLKVDPSGPSRSKSAPATSAVVIEGVPRLHKVRHGLETAMQELRLPTAKREKHKQERRLREAMRVVAQWSRREGA